MANPPFGSKSLRLPIRQVLRERRQSRHQTPKSAESPNMGGCMSSNNDEVEQKKRSQAIDKELDEDSKRLRKECKILLLGMSLPGIGGP